MSHLIYSKGGGEPTRFFYYKLSLQEETDSEYQKQHLNNSLSQYLHVHMVNLVKAYGWNLHKPGSGIWKIRCILQFKNKIITPRLSGSSSHLPEIIPINPKQISIKVLKQYFTNLSKEKVIFTSCYSKEWNTLTKKIEALSEGKCQYKQSADELKRTKKQGEQVKRHQEEEGEEDMEEREAPTKKLKTAAECINLFDIPENLYL